MGLLDGPMGGVADTLIGLFGGTATLKQFRKEHDKRTDQNVNKPTLSWPVQIYPPVSFRVSQWNGNLIEAGDLKTGISREALELLDAPMPEVGMVLVIDSKEYRIKSVLPVKSGNLVAMYELQVGK